MKCARCQADLGEGVNYCVGCGHTNEGATMSKSIKAQTEINKRIERGKMWRSLRRIPFLGFFFRR